MNILADLVVLHFSLYKHMKGVDCVFQLHNTVWKVSKLFAYSNIEKKMLRRFDLKARKISHYSLTTEVGRHGKVLSVYLYNIHMYLKISVK